MGAGSQAALDIDGRPDDVFEIVERDDGHVRVNDAARYFTPHWGRVDDWAYERVRGRVLDIGCGACRPALELQAHGVAVVAPDPSPGVIAVCRRRGLHQVIEGTIDAVETQRAFDTLLLLGHNLGLLASREQAPSFLLRLAELSTGPGAQILASGIVIEPGAAASDTADGAYVRSNPAQGRLPRQVRMRSRFRTLATPWFDYLFLRLPELSELIATTPWRVADHVAEGPNYGVRLELTHAP